MAQIKIKVLSVKKPYLRDFTKLQKFRTIPEQSIILNKKRVCYYQEVFVEVVGGDDSGRKFNINTPIKAELNEDKTILSLYEFKEGDIVEVVE